MLPLAVFRVRQFTVTNAVTFIVYAALGGALFLLPLQLQVVDHYSPLESGAALLPLTVVLLLLSARSGRLATRIGPRLQMSVGPVVVGARPGPARTDPHRLLIPVGGAAGGAGLRIGACRHGRALDGDGSRSRARRTLRRGLGREQRRGPGREPHRRRRAPRAGRDLRDQLPASGRTVERVPEGGAHLRRSVCRRRPPRRRRHPEPASTIPGRQRRCRVSGPGGVLPLRARRQPGRRRPRVAPRAD